MGIAERYGRLWRAFLVGITIGGVGVYFALSVAAATAIITPDGNGSVNNGAPQTGCVGLSNFQCVDSETSTSSSPSSEYLLQTANQVDEFTMTSVGSVDQVSQVVVWVNHIENSANMTLSVSLHNATNSAQYGSTVNLANQGATGWAPAYMSGTNFPLSQQQLDGLRVRITCTKGGGKATSCDTYAILADVVYTETIDIIASSTGSQQNVTASTTNTHLGGAFTISEETGSRNITSITIEEKGTIDEQTELDNIRLYYELAADCSTASFDGTEDQYGATTTFSANGTSTFTETVAVSTANDMCLYPVVDVLNSADPGDTIAVQITDPTVDITASGLPAISPSIPVKINGTSTVEKVILNQVHYHWRDDSGDESGAASLTGTEDQSFLSAGIGTNYRIRMEVTNDGNVTSASTAYGLEYGTKVTNCSALAENDWIAVSAGGGDWDMAGTGSGLADGDTINISNTIGGVTDVGGTFVGTGGERETTGTTSAVTLGSDEFYEMEFAITAQGSASPGTTYCFRVSDDGQPLDLYTSTAYPEATIASDVTIVATSTAAVTAAIPDTDIFAGGFVMTDGTAGAHEIQSITLTASGTVDLQDHVENITIRYESDTTAPRDCSGLEYDGTETIYGTVNTGGFNAAATSTFTDTGITVENGVNALCFWVEFDVTASSTNGETFEVRLQNASTDVVVDTGSVSPASLLDLNGFTTFVEPIVTLEHYHWRDNLGTEGTAGSLTGAEDTAYTELPKDSTVRLRFGVSNTGGTTTAPIQYRLEWAQKVTNCTEVVSWIDIDTPSDGWSTSTSQLVHNADTTDILITAGGVTNVGSFISPNGGQQEDDGTTNNITLDTAEFVEIEYAIRANTSLSEGSSYCFRLSASGTSLDAYDVYAEATIKLDTDFKIQRGSTTIPSGQTSATITAGSQYEAPAFATTSFIRILNSGMTGRGPVTGATGNNNAQDVTAYISNPSNITSSITFTRFGSTNDTHIEWEIVEYIGDASGENEMLVREAEVITYVAAETSTTTATIPNIADDNDVVVFITGQGNPDNLRSDYNTGLSMSSWNAGADTATFTRGEAGGDAVAVSYAVVEFTGLNWKTQRVEMNYDGAYVPGTTATTAPVTSVGSLDKAFIHAQHIAGTGEDKHADFGHEVWLSSIGAVSFRLNGGTNDPTLHTSVAWIIENTQDTGDVLVVTRDNDTITADAGGLTTVIANIGKTVDDITVTGISFNSSNGGTTRTYPEPILSAQLISDTQYQVQVTDDNDANLYRIEIIEWPTAARKLYQDDFWLYEDDDNLPPSTAWNGGTLGENAPMTENTDPMAFGDSVRIRMNIRVEASAQPAGIDAFELEFAENPGSCSAATGWHLVGTQSSTTAVWRGHAATPADGTTLSSFILGASTVYGTYEEDTPTVVNPNLALVGDRVEYDWNIEHNGAKDKTSYCFRMVEGDRDPLTGYDTYPVLRTVGYGPEIGHWQWFNDATSTTPTAQLANEDVAASGVAENNTIKLRLVLTEKQGATGVNTKFALQYSEHSNFTQGVYDVVSSSTCAARATTTSQIWCYDDGAGSDNERITTSVLTGITCTTGTEPGCGTRNEATTTASTFDHTAFTSAEFEFTLRNDGARAGAVYYFRLYDLVNDEPVVASSTYPSLSAASAALFFTVNGQPAGTTTEGVTADVTTTPTSIPFGSVPLDTQYEAVYRLEVDTNATEGYQLFMFSTQDLLNSYGESIASIPSTNAVPDGWTDACPPGTVGCFGYHTGDDVLAGGSTRFSADDTYARVSSTTPDEIMFSSTPAEDAVDVVYKLQVSGLQPAGTYEADIVYIAIPTF